MTGENSYLRDSTTVSILPAAREARQETGITWYEVQVSRPEKRVRVIAFSKEVGIVGLAGSREISAEFSERSANQRNRHFPANTPSRRG